MHLRKKLVSVLLSAAMIATAMMAPGKSTVTSSQSNIIQAATTDTSTFDNLDQDDMVAAMGAGWNLGNQLEAVNNGYPAETNWGNPTITESLIKAVKNAGFSTIRIPVSYMGYIGSASSYTVNSSWLNRVQEVVDMCIDNGLYVIINMHGDGYTTLDGGWLLCGSSDQTTIKAKYKAVWKQIATTFKDYDEHLIFESMNEEFDGTYGTPDSTAYSNINAYNQIFVDTVRQTGGNNDKRWLLIPGWNTNIAYTAGSYGFEIPSDSYLSSTLSGKKRIMISVHYYDPWEFCGTESSSVTQWGSTATSSSKVASWGDESYMKSSFQSMYTKFVQSGYPVIIGEYGSIDKSSYDSNNTACRAKYAERVCYYADQYGMVPVLWDNGYNGDYGFGVFDRSSYSVTQQEIIDAIMSIYPASSSGSSTTTSLDGTYYIKSTYSNLYLDVTDGSSSNSANIEQYTYNGSDAQKFKLVSAGDGSYYIYTGASSYQKVVDVAGASSADGANVLQYTYKGSTNQKFKLQEVSSGVYAILTGSSSYASCLDVYGWSTAAGGNIAQWSYWGGACQLWTLVAASASSSTGTDMTWNFGTSAFSSLGTISSATTVNSLTMNATSSKTMSVQSASLSFNGTTYSSCLALGGSGNTSYRSVCLNVTGACKITVIGKSSGSSTRTLAIANSSGSTLSSLSETSSLTSQTYSYSGTSGTLYLYSTGSGINLYQISVTY